ncbi:hypothetical protein [Thermococcus prieurii]
MRKAGRSIANVEVKEKNTPSKKGEKQTYVSLSIFNVIKDIVALTRRGTRIYCANKASLSVFGIHVQIVECTLAVLVVQLHVTTVWT